MALSKDKGRLLAEHGIVVYVDETLLVKVQLARVYITMEYLVTL